MFHVEHTPKMSTNTPATLPALQLFIEAEIRNPRQYTPTEGSNAGHTYYTADAELSTPGARWSTIRLKVRSATPMVAGRVRLSLVKVDQNEGVGVADIIVEGK